MIQIIYLYQTYLPTWVACVPRLSLHSPLRRLEALKRQPQYSKSTYSNNGKEH